MNVELHDLRIGGGVLLVAAAVAAALPVPVGVPCPLRSLTGIPCPLCGMTTSVTALAQLDPVAALAANPAGVVAVLVALGLLLFRSQRVITTPAWLAVVAVTSMELWQLARAGII